MTPQEIITELRKIASYSTSKKDVCTQAADLIEEYQEEYDIISAANIELESSLKQVVHCKDCKYSEWLKSKYIYQCCNPSRVADNQKYADDFCSYGERRTK